MSFDHQSRAPVANLAMAGNQEIGSRVEHDVVMNPAHRVLRSEPEETFTFVSRCNASLNPDMIRLPADDLQHMFMPRQVGGPNPDLV